MKFIEKRESMNIYVIRHGQTLWNTEHRFQGQNNSDLTTIGKEQARRMGRFFESQGIFFDEVYASPLGRTRETAVYLNLQNEIIFDDRLKEIHLGIWEGCKYEELAKNNDFLAEAFWNNPLSFQAQGGENYQDLLDRSFSVLKEISIKSYLKNVLIITHGAVIRTLYSYVEQGELKNGKFRPVPNSGTYSLFRVDENNNIYSVDYEVTVCP